MTVLTEVFAILFLFRLRPPPGSALQARRVAHFMTFSGTRALEDPNRIRPVCKEAIIHIARRLDSVLVVASSVSSLMLSVFLIAVVASAAFFAGNTPRKAGNRHRGC